MSAKRPGRPRLGASRRAAERAPPPVERAIVPTTLLVALAFLMSARRRALPHTGASGGAADRAATAPDEPRPPVAADAGHRPARRGIDSLWPLVERVIAPTTLLVALAYHFGRQQTSARSAYFGIDVSLLGFSTQDFIVRSADAVFVPLGTLALVSLFCVEFYAFACRAADRSPSSRLLRRAVLLAGFAGVLLLAFGIYGAVDPLPDWLDYHYLQGSLMPAAGILLIAFAARIRRRLAARARTVDPPAAEATRKALVAAVIVLSLFWTASEFATANGRERAKKLAANLPGQPAAVVFSRTPLPLTGPGVTESAITRSGTRYRYRYDGLRFFIRSGGRYFFLPECWTRQQGTAIVLGESSEVRFEFLPPHREGAPPC